MDITCADSKNDCVVKTEGEEDNDIAIAEDNSMECNPVQREKRKKSKPNSKNKRQKLSNQQPKNALMRLNEMKPGLVYNFESQKGPPHDPIFVMSVEVNEQKFIGEGNSKQMAKHAAAHAALSSFVQFENMPEAMQILQPPIPNMDFTSDNVEHDSAKQKNGVAHNNLSEMKFAKKLQRVITEGNRQNPIMMLNEIRPGIEYRLVRENAGNPTHRFVMGVTLDGEVFEAAGPSKKLAKADAARLALSKRYNVRFASCGTSSSTMSLANPELFNFPQKVADKIAKCVNDTFTEIMVGNDEYAKWTVLAGIVMTKDKEMDNVEVVAIGTGTKHLNGEYMSMNGAVVNDCHAEVIARRCLKDFFYTQLELHVEGEGDQSIFLKKPDDKFCLRPDIKFHLFISTSPCGDARIFSVHHDEELDVIDPHPNRKARGLLRTKIESGEGTIPVRAGTSTQTWDAIIQGQQRYLAMSCSDKLASWNVLGLQGSLLGKFIEPIYLDSLVLGRLFHNDHLFRAMCGRIVPFLGDLPAPYHLQKPKMCGTTTLEVRQLTKSPNFSINWTIGLGRPEVVIAKTGKVDNGSISRLAKRSLFQRYSNLFQALSNSPGVEPQCRIYSAMKQSNATYMKAKKELAAAFVLAGLGSWVEKPVEEDEFELTF